MTLSVAIWVSRTLSGAKDLADEDKYVAARTLRRSGLRCSSRKASTAGSSPSDLRVGPMAWL